MNISWKTILRSLKNREMQKKLLAVLGIIVAYRFLAHIPVPLAEPTELKEVVNSVINGNQFGGFLDLLSGGALAAFSIVLAGLSPFITASIITQLLTKAIPKLEELHKDGEAGRRKINQWTRLISVPLAIIQSITFIYILRQTVLASNSTVLADTSALEWVMAVGAMTAGSLLLMWLGELITEQGIGNGISLLIFAGIISQFPATLVSVGSSLLDTSAGTLSVFGWFSMPVNPLMFYSLLALTVVGVLMLYLLVKINEAQRVITVNYAKRVHSSSAYHGIKSVLPIKLIAAGVIPVIFAVAFLSLPAFVGQLMKAMGNPAYAEIANNLVTWFQTPNFTNVAAINAGSFVYPAAYFILVILFTYFYTGIVFNSNEVAENLQKQGGFIEGVRPGPQTEKYLSTTVNRLILFGSIALGLIAVTPFAVEFIAAQFGLNAQNLAIGGTGFLIVVTVGLETLRQLNSRALMVTYDDYK
ncbi:MAG: preprotein translocase subunit SecY [Candidatus Saccharimonadaceae bacterium]